MFKDLNGLYLKTVKYRNVRMCIHLGLNASDTGKNLQIYKVSQTIPKVWCIKNMYIPTDGKPSIFVYENFFTNYWPKLPHFKVWEHTQRTL